jgi:hypothetical protein
MPYHLEKGPYWSVAESVVNSDAITRAHILDLLRRGDPMMDLANLGETMTSTTLHSPATPTAQTVKEHGEQHFFGGSYDQQGHFVSGPPPFQNYSGNIEQIMRTTFIRAIEVSFGLATGEKLASPKSPPRFWPIEYIWKCPTAWVEGWVTWRTEPDGTGHVSVHVLTPAHGHPVLSTPMAGRNTQLNPTDCSGLYGMWLITHEAHDKHVEWTTDNSEFAVWNLPMLGPVYKGVGDVIVVAPSEEDGGVAPNGRTFEAPP